MYIMDCAKIKFNETKIAHNQIIYGKKNIILYVYLFEHCIANGI